MSRYINVLRVIEAARDAFGANNSDNDTGSCLKFHIFLRHIFDTEAKGFYNSKHVITFIRGIYVDAGGVVDFTKHDVEFLPLSEFKFVHMAEEFKFVNLTAFQLTALEHSCND